MTDLQTDVALIGAGPIGVEMAVGLKRAGIDYLHFDAGQVGATVQWFAPGTRFFSSPQRIAIAGVPLQTIDQGKATREEYLRYLRSVVLQFDLAINTFEPVRAIERREDGFVLITEPLAGAGAGAGAGGRCCRARRVILATGGTARPRRLNIPGEDLPHVHAYFQEPHAYFRQRVLIVGGKNSAVEAALRIHHVGGRVALSYRRPALDAGSIKYWLLPEINGLLNSQDIAGHFATVPVEITPEHVVLSRVNEQRQPVPEALIKVPADRVLLMVGYEADMSLCRMAGVALEGPCQAPAHDPLTMQTNVPGVYVAGTAVAGTQDRYRLFIENCHVHVDRILAALQGHARPLHAPEYERPES